MYVRAALHCGSSNLGGLLDVPAEKYQFIFLCFTQLEKNTVDPYCPELLISKTRLKL